MTFIHSYVNNIWDNTRLFVTIMEKPLGITCVGNAPRVLRHDGLGP